MAYSRTSKEALHAFSHHVGMAWRPCLEFCLDFVSLLKVDMIDYSTYIYSFCKMSPESLTYKVHICLKIFGKKWRHVILLINHVLIVQLFDVGFISYHSPLHSHMAYTCRMLLNIYHEQLISNRAFSLCTQVRGRNYHEAGFISLSQSLFHC